MQYKRFAYKELDELKQDIAKNGLDLDISEDTKILKREVKVGGYVIPNSLAVHPMEGCDAKSDGSPDELTIRRYERFAAGGAGLLWLEATAVVPEGRANPKHFWITRDNVDAFKSLSDTIKNTAFEANGHTPVSIVQLTHAGRFSRPVDKPAPTIAYHNPYFNERFDIPESHPVIGDDELERLEDAYVETALLAKEAGFSGVDIKGCHRYLISELFSAYNREGKYGGSFENRMRFITNIVDKVQAAVGSDFIIASRLNIYDGIPYPYGWGVDKDDYKKADFSEPLKLIDILYEKGVRLINITMGTPYYNPHVNRPYDGGGYTPDEGQLEGVARLISGAGVVQKRHPDMAIVGTGYSWLRQFMPYVAAGTVAAGKASVIGLGRGAFAYPDFAKDIINNGEMVRKKCCTACSKCTELMRAKSSTGCVVRDTEVYMPLYKKNCLKK
jgi:2,4-dienoyl-CoA reductase-like NADH-dependent reductase (Old Yellow Enzyme family)